MGAGKEPGVLEVNFTSRNLKLLSLAPFKKFYRKSIAFHVHFDVHFSCLPSEQF